MVTLDLNGNRTVEVDELTFTVEPESFEHFVIGLSKAASKGELDDIARTRCATLLSLSARISDWTGVGLPDGSAAECNATNKDRLFGQRPDLLFAIERQVNERDESAEKNLPSSPDG